MKEMKIENMVDAIHIHTCNRVMKPLTIVLSGVGRRFGEEG
jgi:hypothetical protein